MRIYIYTLKFIFYFEKIFIIGVDLITALNTEPIIIVKTDTIINAPIT